MALKKLKPKNLKTLLLIPCGLQGEKKQRRCAITSLKEKENLHN
jgi:hypothetical protein